MRYSSIPEALSFVVLQNRQDDVSPTLSDSSYAERCSDVYVLTGRTPALSISAHGYVCACDKLFHLPSSHRDLANIQYDFARWFPTCPAHVLLSSQWLLLPPLSPTSTMINALQERPEQNLHVKKLVVIGLRRQGPVSVRMGLRHFWLSSW